MFACHLGTTPETEETFTFSTLRETIGGADSVLILLKDTTGKALNVLFEDRVTASTSFSDLKAKDYHGGKVVIYIEAWKDGQLIYKTERNFDPAKGGDQERIVHVAPPRNARDSLRLTPDTLTLALRGPVGRFSPIFTPLSSVQPVIWTALQAGIVAITPDGLITPRSQGITRVVATFQANPLVSDTAFARVLPAQAVDSIRFEKRTSDLFLLGAAEILAIKIHPPLAPPEVVFSVRDSDIVRLEGNSILGLKEGETFIIAVSQEDPSKRDSLAVLVLSQEPVDSVRLAEDTLRLFVKGQGLPLTPSLYPARSKTRYLWHSEDEAVATVDSAGRVSPLSPGQTLVVVRARADTAQRDQALILVKRDVPRIHAGGDTVIARGDILTHSLLVTQEYGQVTMFKWDLDGDGSFEDSSLTPPAALSHQYSDAKDYMVRFLARDIEGNDTIHVRRVKAVNGRVVQITSPKDGSSTNQVSIPVIWQLDGAIRTDTAILSLGTNVLRRSAVDSAGNVYTHAVTVILDQTAPEPPLVKGPEIPVNTLTPRLSWSSRDSSGSGVFRIRVDNPNLDPSGTTFDTTFLAAGGLAEGVRTLYVQERDEAGNWSASGSYTIRIDTTPPPSPAIQVNPASPTNTPRPTWSWSGSIGDAYRFYRFKLDDDDFRTGARDTTATSFQPPVGLSEGQHTLYVQARDSAGNWSSTVSRVVRLDYTPPAPPKLDESPYTPLNSSRPKWTWRSGEGGARVFRAGVDKEDLNGVLERTDSIFISESHLSEGPHTIYVQERDSSGNWSASAKKLTVIAFRKELGDSKPFVENVSTRADIVSYKDGTAILAYQTGVKRFTGQGWEALGNPAAFGEYGDGSSVAVSQTGVPYLALTDSAGRASVLRFSSNRWMPVGNQSFTPGGAGEVALAISKSEIPYVAFRDDANAGKASVMRWNGNTWEYVGPRGISTGFSVFFRIVLTNTGVPIIAFLDNINSETRVVIRRYDALSDSWIGLGNLAVHSYNNHPISLVNTDEDSLFVALNVAENAGAGEVYKFNGSAWTPVGDPVYSSPNGRYPFLAISSRREKYVAYTDLTGGDGVATIKVLRGNSWITMATFSTLTVVQGLALGPDDVPWVLFDIQGELFVWKASFDP